MSEVRRHRHSRAESVFREEAVAFRNGAGLLLRGTLLFRWSESPFSSPQHSHAHSAHRAQQPPMPQQSTPHAPSPISTMRPFPSSIATTPSSSPPSGSSQPNSTSLSPCTPSALTSALADLKIDTPRLSRGTSRNTSPVGSPHAAVHPSSGGSTSGLSINAGSGPPSPSFNSAIYSPASATALLFPPPSPPSLSAAVSVHPHSAASAAHPAAAAQCPAALPAVPSPFPFPSPGPRVAIVCHGMAVHSQWGFLPELCDSLLKEVSGLSAVLRFDFAGCGLSEGEFEFGGYSKQTDDIASAVAAMRARGYAVHALIGHSMGGNCVLLYASSHHDIPNIININARYQMTRGLPFGPEQLTALQQQGWFIWKPRGATLDTVRVTQETINERLSLDMDCVRRIATRDDSGQYRVRVLTVHGNNDAVVPVQDAHSYAELINNHTLRTLDDCDHSYITQQAKLMLSITLCEWMSKEGNNDSKRHSTGSSSTTTTTNSSTASGADSGHSSPTRSSTLPPPHPNPIHSSPLHPSMLASALPSGSAPSFSAAISPTTSSPLSTSPSSLAKGLLAHRRSPSL